MTLVSVPANPVPHEGTSGTLTTSDGRRLRFARWAPPPGRKGTVCLFQGRAEFIEKYFETVQDLRSRGFAVATLDWRGQGLSDRVGSDPQAGHVGNFNEYQTDLETFMRQVVLPDCPPPLFAIAHSMGAAIMLQALNRGHRWFDRVVLLTPMVALPGFRATAAPRIVTRVLRAIGLGRMRVPSNEPGGTQMRAFLGNPLTSDPVRYARNLAVLEAEPGLVIGRPTIGWTNAALRTMHTMMEPEFAARIRQPVLIIAAGNDEVVSTPAITGFATRLRAGSHLVVAGARHELLMEQDRFRSQAFAAIDAFVPGTPLFA